MSDEVHSYHRTNAQAREAFRVLVSVVNVQAFDEAAQTAAAWFLPWDTLEDLMPFFSFTARAFIVQTIFYDPGSPLLPPSPVREVEFDIISKLYHSLTPCKYAGEVCKDLNGFDMILHEPLPVPDCLQQMWWQKIVVGYVDFESFDVRESGTRHQRFKTHTYERSGGGLFTVSFEVSLPVIYISNLPDDCTTAAVEALMPNNGSTVVRVVYLCGPAWQGMAVEFDSFEALNDTMKTHQQNPFVLGGVSLEMETKEPHVYHFTPPGTPNSHEFCDYDDWKFL